MVLRAGNMSESRQKMVAVRAAFKGHCTRDVREAHAIMRSEMPNLNELQEISERIGRRMRETTQMDNEIAMSYEEEKLIQKEVDEALTYNDELNSLQRAIAQFITDAMGDEEDGAQRTRQESHSPPQRVAANLPKLTLKTFSGDPLD